jgi:hypothetical protein
MLKINYLLRYLTLKLSVLITKTKFKNNKTKDNLYKLLYKENKALCTTAAMY